MNINLKKIIKEIIIETINEIYTNETSEFVDLSEKDINMILKGYLETAIWTEELNIRDYLNSIAKDKNESSKYKNLKNILKKINNKKDKLFTIKDFDKDSIMDAYKDIKTFIKNAGINTVKAAIKQNGLERLGMDIWLTRNGHGAGFFDHIYDDDIDADSIKIETNLIKAAKNLNTKHLDIDYNGKLFFV